MRSPLFTGVCPALVTPFHMSGDIDYEALDRLIEYQISAGVSALCVCGTTGEASTLSPQERSDLISFCVSHAAGRVPVIAGTGCNNTAKAAEWSKMAESLGADGLLVVTPYYNKATQKGLLCHYREIAKNTSLPIILYNVPGRTGVAISVDTYAVLAENAQFNGVKEASGDISYAARIRSVCPDDFSIWSGNDDQTAPVMSIGGKGVISVASNIIPDIMCELMHSALQQEYKRAASLQATYMPLFDALFCEVNPIPVKAAMAMLGMCDGSLRLPLCPISTENSARLRMVLEHTELL